MNLDAIGDDRKMPRVVWKWYYRQLRIVRREGRKALMDAAVYGTGFYQISGEGFVNHVLPQSVRMQ